MKTKLSILFLGLAIFLLAFASAANDNQLGESNKTDKNETPALISAPSTENASETAKNMTHGLCISEIAKVRTDCYNIASEKQSTCKTSAENKATTKNCKNEYKKDKNQCKSDFKSSKETCKQYKKTFADKLKFWQ
jgi:hypothetical protein